MQSIVLVLFNHTHSPKYIYIYIYLYIMKLWPIAIPQTKSLYYYFSLDG